MPLGRNEFHAFIHVDAVLGADVAGVGVEVVSCVTVDGVVVVGSLVTLVVVVVDGSIVTSLVVASADRS